MVVAKIGTGQLTPRFGIAFQQTKNMRNFKQWQYFYCDFVETVINVNGYKTLNIFKTNSVKFTVFAPEDRTLFYLLQ